MTKEEERALPIGVFDSGIGGLTVAREIMRQMPNEKIVYFGDTARVPYGSKSRDTVLKYSQQIVRFLLEQKVKAIAVACNTASAYALPVIEKDCPVPVITASHRWPRCCPAPAHCLSRWWRRASGRIR